MNNELETNPIVDRDTHAKKRPAFVSNMAIIYGLIGLISIVEAFSRIGKPVGPLEASLLRYLAYAGLTIASAAGMWQGKKWAWWLGTFFAVYYITAFLLLMTPILGPGTAGIILSGQPILLKVFVIGKVLFFTLILFYLFSKRVTTFFEATHLRWYASVAILAAISIIALIL